MTTDEIQHAALAQDLMTSPKSRAHFLKGAAVAAAGLGLAPSIAKAAALDGKTLATMPETAQSILNIAATAEAAAVTALYNLHVAVNQGRVNVSGIAVPVPTLVHIVRAILRQEQDHYAFLTGAGAKPLVTSFTFPPAILTSAIQALRFLETADEIFAAAYLAANREFAQGGLATLARYSYQIGGTEEAHRELARAAQGKLPNNRSYVRNLFPNRVNGAVRVFTELGVLKPGLRYPGAMAVDAILRNSVDHDVTAGVTLRHP
jgi:hypothetical protein